jgi:hypothetical protein
MFSLMMLAVIALATPTFGVAGADGDRLLGAHLADERTDSALEDTTTNGDPFLQLVRSKGGLGAYHRADGTIVVVVPASGSSAFRVTDAAGFGVSVVLETRDIEPTEVAAIKDRVAASSWRPAPQVARPLAVFDPRTGKVRIHSDAPIEEFSDIFADFPGKVAYAGRGVRLQTRSADFAPHWGGAKMVSPSISGYCTSGFAVNNSSGNPRMLTAGHCFLVNWTVNSPGGTTFGEVKNRGNYPLSDFEIVGGGGVTHEGAIYVGNSTGTQKNVNSAANPTFTGGPYCTSGFNTAERCGVTLLDDDVNVCLTDYWGVYGCRQHAMLLEGGLADGTCPGDSGAPLFSYINSGAKVKIGGLVFAGPSFENEVDCHIYSDYTIIEKWTKIRDELSLTILTK